MAEMERRPSAACLGRLGGVSYLLVSNEDDAGYTHALVEKRRKGEVSWKAVAAAMQAAIVPAVEKRILAMNV